MRIRLTVFAAGTVLMAAEVLAFRIVGRTFGTALRETTAVITVFLAAMSVGYWAGGRFGDRFPKRAMLVAPMLGSAVWLAVLPFIDRPVSDWIATSSLPFALHALAVNLLLFAVPTALLASVSPIAIRLLTRTLQTTGRTAGGIAALSAVGSIAGTILTGFYLIGAFPISHILRGLALALLAVSLVALLRTKRGECTPADRGTRAGHVAVILGACAAMAAAVGPACAKTIYEHDSAYHHILVEDRGRYRYLFFDDSRQSRMLRDNPIEGGYAYTRYFHMPWVFMRSIDSVLFIGLGGGTGPKQYLHDYPGVRVRVAEVDPAVIRVAEDYFGMEANDRLRIDTMDGRVALHRMRDRVDVIVVDAYYSGRYGSSIPFHLTTREFFDLAARRLTDDGIVLYNVIQKPSSRNNDFIRALSKTMKHHFEELYFFECDDSGNTVILALKTPQHLDARDLVARARELVEDGVVLRDSYHRYAADVYDGRLRFEDVPILTDDYAPVDQLLGR